ncbi:MAG: lyase family protein [Acidilobaceae archaeon]
MYREKLLGVAEALPFTYISSMETDKLIACETLEVVKAYLKGLVKAGAVDEQLASSIEAELLELQRDPSPLWREEAADIHEAIESYLVKKLGLAASQIALGRSRNDQVAAALRLKTKTLLYEILAEIAELRRTALDLALSNLETPIPAYTHERPAQVSSLAHYLSYLDEMLEDYERVLSSVLEIVDKSPLGAGPAAGTMVPIDRAYVSSLLFRGLVYNSLYASGSRDFLMLAVAVAASLLVALSRIASDLIYFSSPEAGFLELPSSHLDTSSIMPHKKNPVTLEIIRARAGEAVGRLAGIMSIAKGLRSGYSLDFQEANDDALYVLIEAKRALAVLRDALSKTRVDSERARRYLEEFQPVAAEVAELLALKTGKPFREVYWEIARAIREEGGLERALEKMEKLYGVRVTVDEALRKPSEGSPNPDYLRRRLESRLAEASLRSSELRKILESARCR